jgi:hypothetical protein
LFRCRPNREIKRFLGHGWSRIQEAEGTHFYPLDQFAMKFHANYL